MANREEPPLPSPIELAHRPEIAVFSECLAHHVDTGDGRDELTIATAAVVRLARELRLEAVPIVEAVELIGAPPSAQLNLGAAARGERYGEAMAWLVRGLLNGS